MKKQRKAETLTVSRIAEQRTRTAGKGEAAVPGERGKSRLRERTTRFVPPNTGAEGKFDGVRQENVEDCAKKGGTWRLTTSRRWVKPDLKVRNWCTTKGNPTNRQAVTGKKTRNLGRIGQRGNTRT